MHNAKKVRCCTLRCDLKGDLVAQIIEVDEDSPALRGYDSVETIQRCVDAFERGVDDGLLQLAFGEVASTLPAALSCCREWMKSMITQWLLALRANPRAKLDPPPGLIESWVRLAHRIPELARLRVDCLRRVWKSHQQAAKARLAQRGEGLAASIAGTHPAWTRVGDVVLRIDEGSGDAARPFVLHCLFVEGLSTTTHVRVAPIYGPIFGDNRVPGLGDYLYGVLVAAAERSEVLRRLLDSQEIYSPCGLIPRDAHKLLLDAPALEDMGLDIRVPLWWKQRKPPRFGVHTRIGTTAPAGLSLSGLLDVHTTYVVDEHELSEAEWRRIVTESTNGLVLIRGHWVEVDHVRVQRTMQRWQASEALRARGRVPYAEALAILEAARAETQDPGDPDVMPERFSPGPWFAGVRGAVQRKEIRGDIDPGPEFHGVLRPYQREGVAWLAMLMELRVGALLADDMGLGKTCQIIALLLGLRRRGEPGPYLLVVPASLIGNWRDEIRKFAKTLPFTIVHHGYSDGSTSESNDLVITSYTTLWRRPALRDRAWGLVVLDEAQTIKTATGKLTHALKSLSSRLRIALTGTPVENSPMDLWSIMDFLNPGLLGTATAFRTWWRSLREDTEGGVEKLRATLRPYMLRRRKIDPGIAPELPEKMEVTAYCGLTATQSDLYCQVLRSAQARVQAASGRKRDGVVLNLILQLKHICNHPALYLEDGQFDVESSAKFLRLRQICQTIAESGEKVLVFSQFQTLTEPLAALLAEVFGRPGLVFDGETPVSRRSEIVAQFQNEHGPPFMILSLKAGGNGLNLTAATHVIHFDLWWNPAWEAQASDRAHRIGQTRRVMVHRLVCRGTLEERIDEILQRKRAIAEDLLAPEDESAAVTKLDDNALMRMIDLDETQARGTGESEEA